MSNSVKKTLLHAWHLDKGANMAAFGQYDMPLWYPTGAKEEHLSVVTRAGLFDTSHMSTLMVRGPGAFDLLQLCFSKDLTKCLGKRQMPLAPGRCVYGVFLNSAGEVIDDAIVFHLDPALYMVVVNSGMGPTISAHLQRHTGGSDVVISDLTDRLGKLDVQGPQSALVLSRLIKDAEKVFAKMPYFSFKGHFEASSPLAVAVNLTNGAPLLLSRTGYTGEFGFELFVEPGAFVDLWASVCEAGRAFGLLPCGLAARDSLRSGAVLPLSHQDIGAWPFKNHPWPFALPHADGAGFTKDFVGADALRRSDYSERTYPFAGYDLRKVSIHGGTTVVDDEGTEIGQVLTCTTDMAIGRHEDRIVSIASPDKPAGFVPRGLSCGFVRVKKPIEYGRTVTLKDARRAIPVEIVADVRPDRTARKPLSFFL